MMGLFRQIEDSGFANEEQRNVWTTWKINVGGLSEKAKLVFRAFAFFDEKPISELVVKHLDPQFLSYKPSYLQCVHEELVKGACLLDHEDGEEGAVFRMHHLVREFVVFDTKCDEARFRAAVKHAIYGLYSHVRYRLSEVGNCVDDLPELWPPEFASRDSLVSHAVKLLKDVSDSTFLCSEVSWMKELMFLF